MQDLRKFDYTVHQNGKIHNLVGYVEVGQNVYRLKNGRVCVRNFHGVHTDPQTTLKRITIGSVDKIRAGGCALDFWELKNGGDEVFPVMHFLTQNKNKNFSGSGSSVDPCDYYRVIENQDCETLVTDFRQIDPASPEYQVAQEIIGTFYKEVGRLSTRMHLAIEDELETQKATIDATRFMRRQTFNRSHKKTQQKSNN
jgi:hypothetical protein